MKYKELKRIADPNSITLHANPDNGIVSVLFRVNNIEFAGQYDDDSDGLYGIAISDKADVLTVLNACRSASDG